MEKVTHVRSSDMKVDTDVKSGTVTITFKGEKQDVEIRMRAFDALDVGLKILVGVNTLLDVLSEWMTSREETVQ